MSTGGQFVTEVFVCILSVLDLNAFERQNKAEGLGMVSEEGSSEYEHTHTLSQTHRRKHTHRHTHTNTRMHAHKLKNLHARAHRFIYTGGTCWVHVHVESSVLRYC